MPLQFRSAEFWETKSDKTPIKASISLPPSPRVPPQLASLGRSSMQIDEPYVSPFDPKPQKPTSKATKTFFGVHPNVRRLTAAEHKAKLNEYNRRIQLEKENARAEEEKRVRSGASAGQYVDGRDGGGLRPGGGPGSGGDSGQGSGLYRDDSGAGPSALSYLAGRGAGDGHPGNAGADFVLMCECWP